MRVQLLSPQRSPNVDDFLVLRPEGKDPFGSLHLPAALKMTLSRAISGNHGTGKDGESLSFPIDSGGVGRLTLIGVGKAEKLGLKKLRSGIRGALRQAAKNGAKKVALGIAAPMTGAGSGCEDVLLLETLLLADYEYRAWKTTGEPTRWPEEIRFVPREGDDEDALEVALREAKVLADSVRWIRDLANAPSNDLTPTKLADAAKQMAGELDLRCTVFGPKELVREGFGGLLAVNKGSVEEPRFIIVDYPGPKGSKSRPTETICLVGKGLTFDSGGISIKPAAGMGDMKYDMCGAAAVLGAVRAAAALKLPYRIVALVASTDNMPDGGSYKPGDIVKTWSGKTIEIDNTDAEGRVVLADALAYAAKNYEPAAMIDFATLTGACMVALGVECSGLMTPDDRLAEALTAAGEACGERVWRLPLWDDYRDDLRSDWADIRNSGGRWGGAIKGGIFLKDFVGDTPWAHLDIAGTANYEKEWGGLPVGASGIGVKLIVRFLKERSAAA